MEPIRTSLRVVDLPPRRGTYENIGTAYDDYQVQVALVSVVLEAELKRGTSLRALARRLGSGRATIGRLVQMRAQQATVGRAYRALCGEA